MELSDEMKEAIRILREDGQIASYNAMSASHKEMIQRFDEVENNWSEFRAAQTDKDKTPESGGTDSGNPTNQPTSADPSVPEPPPVKTPEPPEEKKTRLRWYERGGYAE